MATEVGLVPKFTVRVVAVAVATVPTAPLLKTTVLLAATVSNANPLMTILDALIANGVVLTVTEGITFATCTALAFALVLVVTTAVMLPALVGFVVKFTVNVVGVAEAIVPTAPLLNVTLLLAAVGSKPNPLIVSVDEAAGRLAVLLVTTGVIEET